MEEKSMFNPVPEDEDIEGGSYKHGSSLKYRDSNENVYNIKHAANRGILDLSHAEMHKYKKMAEEMTKFRRAEFNRIKEAQLKADNRVPHYIDKDGLPKPYSQKFLDSRRKDV
jgi:hypothetical protein